VILLVAIVAAIAITLRTRKETKYQDRATQLAARPADRLKIVKGIGKVIPLSALPRPRRAALRDRRGRHLPQPQEPHHAADGDRADAARREHELRRLLAPPGRPSGQVFVFFILTVAAAESAIGLAILVALFRNLRSINVDDLGSLKGKEQMDLMTLACVAAFSPLVGAILAGFLGWKLGAPSRTR
jgi:hypothetical protein